MKLYTYFRSSAAYRVRIALNLKGLSYESAPIHLLKKEQSASEYLAVNPQGRVPSLDVDGMVLIQSPAILEYLEEVFPSRRCCHPTRSRERGCAPRARPLRATFIP